MHVQKGQRNSRCEFALIDDEGLAIPIVSNFLGYLRARDCSPNTLCAYAHDLRHFFQFLKGASIHFQQFTPRRTLDFLQYLREVPSRSKARKRLPDLNCGAALQPTTQLAPTTVNRILAAVSTFYEYIILTEVDSNNENPLRKIPDIATARVAPRYTPFLSLTTKQRPVRRVVRVRTAQRLPRPLSDEQVTKLYRSFTRQRDKAIFLLMLQGGLRPGPWRRLARTHFTSARLTLLLRICFLLVELAEGVTNPWAMQHWSSCSDGIVSDWAFMTRG